MKKRMLLITFCTLILSGCVSREQADAVMVKGCEAGVNAILPEGRSIDHIVSQTVKKSPEGPGFRHVTLNVIEMDGWLETKAQFDCVFEESFGFMGMSHTASVYQVRTDEKIIGKAGDEITGSFDDFVKLTDAIRKAMYE